MGNKEILQTGYILVPNRRETRFLKINDIMYIIAQDNYSIIVTKEQENYCLCKSLSILTSLLEGTNFFRAHKSYLINTLFIQSVSINSPLYIQLLNGEKIPLARRKKREFINFIRVA